MYSLIIWISCFDFHVLLICGFPFSSNGVGLGHRHSLSINFIFSGECPSLMLPQSIVKFILDSRFITVCSLDCAAQAKSPIVYY
jgi:hypothetical protein